jgi:iron complex outermembrane receptor protein
MVGASEWAANLGGYYENDKVSAAPGGELPQRIREQQHGAGADGEQPGPVGRERRPDADAPTMAAPVTTLAFNASYNLTPMLVLSFDATNLTNVKRAYYRYSEEEQQKAGRAIGRQFYVNLKYRSDRRRASVQGELRLPFFMPPFRVL